jgi:Uma2 family endonuclease
MSLAFREPMTRAEFLDWEERQPLRYEFDGHSPEAMTGGSAAHAIIQGNLAVALISRLRGKPCRFIGNDLKILVGANSSRYPDGFVICSPVDNRATRVSDPVVIFEVLSPSTASKDDIVKNVEYEQTPSAQRYAMLEQDRIGAIVFSRDTGEWRGRVLTEGDSVAMPEIGVDVPLAEFYEGLSFGEADEAAIP